MPKKKKPSQRNRENLNEFIEKEANLVKIWLSFKLGEKLSSKLIDKCTSDKKSS